MPVCAANKRKVNTVRGVVVFTDTYPYAAGEEFFEQEIDILAARFDEVIVVPLRVWQGARQTRRMPDNCQSVLLPAPLSADWRVQALRWLPQIAWTKTRLIDYAPWKDLRRFQMDLRFAATCADVRHRIARVLPVDTINRWDDILFYSYWFYTGAAIARMFKDEIFTQKNVKIVSRAHAYDVDEKDAPYGYIPSRTFVFDGVDVVFPISNYAAGFLLRRFPKRENKIRVSRLGVVKSARQLRDRTENLHIVSCSHMAPYKRVDLIIDTLEELHKRGIHAQWTHIGESDTHRLSTFQAQAALKLPPGSYELLGYQTNTAVRQFLAERDLTLFLNVSNSEGVPVSIMEAQSAALPVVATDVGGTGEIVHDGENGRLVGLQASPRDIADAVMSVWTLGPEDYRMMSRAAHTTWQSMSNAKVQYEHFVAALEGLFDA